MTRAHDLFERLRTNSIAALDELIADKEPESLFLDFKRSTNEGRDKNLAPDDNKNLSKAISGFANSGGGVIVWGVDCRRDRDGNEVATKHPLENAAGFNTKLQAAISRTTYPPHPGVEVLSIQESSDSPAGYVAVHVPQSFFGPIRSLTTHHYHIRTGSDFVIVSHDVLAGLFGRQPQPSVDLNLIFYPARMDSSSDQFTIAFGLAVVNSGAILGERPYISANFGSFPQRQLTVRSVDEKAFVARRSPLPTFSVVATDGFVIAPSGSEHMCDVVIEISALLPQELALDGTLGVRGAPPKRFLIYASEKTISAAIERARRGSISSSTVVELIPVS